MDEGVKKGLSVRSGADSGADSEQRSLSPEDRARLRGLCVPAPGYRDRVIDGGLLGSELASLLDDSDRAELAEWRAERSEALLAEAERQRSAVEAERDRLRADNARLREALERIAEFGAAGGGAWSQATARDALLAGEPS